MRDLRQPRSGPPPWTSALSLCLVLGACPVDDDDTAVPEDPWVVEQDGLSGAALSIWGNDSDDVWVAGTGGAVDEPMLLHRDGGAWEQLDTGATGEAWWVVGDGTELIWVVGEDGLVLRYDRAAGTFTTVDTDTTATLFGAWVAPSGLVYAVGGVVGSSDLGPVLLRIDGDVATEVTDLPSGISNNENFFKVWGSADDDVYVVSDLGTVLHFDGTLWAKQVLPDNPRLVTLHGSGPGDLTVVGGVSRPTIFSKTGLAWEDISPAAGQPLNGVYTTADGGGFAGGFGNFLMERVNGVWSMADGSLALAYDWHGVWIDETGAPWVAGGDLIELTGGVVARRENP